MHKVQWLTIFFAVTSLAACSTYQKSTYMTYQPDAYDNAQYYTQSYDGGADYGYGAEQGKVVSVPDSYYVGSYHSPTSHKDMDKNWVNSQNPQGYTIEVANSEKAAQVAGKLHKMPKTDRMAEIKYTQGGQTYYKGVYGSYNSYEEAQKALNNLPEDIRQEADIKNWNKVQN